jgi:hypothetical protein
VGSLQRNRKRWNAILRRIASVRSVRELPYEYRPFPMRSVLHLLANPDVQEVVRADGTRRRYAELVEGLRDYRAWLRPWRDWGAEVGEMFNHAQEMTLHLSRRHRKLPAGFHLTDITTTKHGYKSERTGNAGRYRQRIAIVPIAKPKKVNRWCDICDRYVRLPDVHWRRMHALESATNSDAVDPHVGDSNA